MALAAVDLPPHVGPVETEETSGSTGRPFVHRRNELVTIANLALTDRVLRWWDFDGNKTLATFISRHRGTRAAAQWRNAPRVAAGIFRHCTTSSICGRIPMCR